VEDLSTQTGAAASFEVMSGLVDMKWQQAIDLGRRETARQYLQAVIRRHHGRVADAAVHAGVERESFYRLLRKFNVQPDGTSDPDDEDT
jgi:two-component system response regulator HydG